MAEEDWHMPIEYYQHIIFIFFLQLQSFMATHCSQYIIPIYPGISEKHHLLLAGLFYIPDSIQCRGGGGGGGGGNRHADIYSENFEFSTCRKCQKCRKIAYFSGFLKALAAF